MSYNVNEKGYYGDFIVLIPEMLYPNVEELRQNYLKNHSWTSFQAEFDDLLRICRSPQRRIFAKRLSEEYTKTHLKEKICVTRRA
jgi:tryptophan synthase beta chain